MQMQEQIAVGVASEGTVALSLPGRRSRRSAALHHGGAYLFLAPYLAVFALFTVVPIIFGIYVSLHNWSETTGAGKFIGFSNYITLIEGRGYYGGQFWQSMWNTIFFVVISVPILWALPTALAYAVYRSPGKPIWRFLFFYPSVFSVTAFGSAWSLLLATNGGAFNSLFHLNIQWLTGMPQAWISLDVATIWATMGFSFIIMYAAITQIPASTIEAAEMDGAGALARFRLIVLPLLRRTSVVVLVINTIASFNLFGQDQIMTNGGPGSATTTISMSIYQQAFDTYNAGGATAAAFLLAIVLGGIAILQLRISRKAA